MVTLTFRKEGFDNKIMIIDTDLIKTQEVISYDRIENIADKNMICGEMNAFKCYPVKKITEVAGSGVVKVFFGNLTAAKQYAKQYAKNNGKEYFY